MTRILKKEKEEAGKSISEGFERGRIKVERGFVCRHDTITI